MRLLPAALALPLLLLAAPRGQAAQSYDNCTGYLSSLPAVISTQGTWCMNKDLATSISSGTAVTINTNNVTLDCNHFKLGGLGAGPGTDATGIASNSRSNITLRNCNIRGFVIGANLSGSAGGGHVVEDNRFEANTYIGLRVSGGASAVRRNTVLDTGNSTAGIISAYGIWVVYDVDVLDNTVAGVTSGPGNGAVTGILVVASGGSTLAGNRIRGLDTDATAGIQPILDASSERMVVRDNHIINFLGGQNVAITCDSITSVALGNVISGFDTPLSGCSDGGNTDIP